MRAETLTDTSDNLRLRFEPTSKKDTFVLCVFETLVLTITDGLKSLYRVEMDEKFMKKHKLDTKLDGDWLGFFKMLKDSIYSKNWSLIRDENDDITLQIKYPCGDMTLNG